MVEKRDTKCFYCDEKFLGTWTLTRDQWYECICPHCGMINWGWNTFYDDNEGGD